MKRRTGKAVKVKASKNQRVGKKLVAKESGFGVLEQKLNRAVVYIAMKDRGFGDRLENIGAYIIKHFFNGDVERVKSQNPIKGFSLKQLADQKGVEISLTSLHRCVELAVQRKELRSFSALKKLSTTHRIALTQVKDLKQKKADIQLILKKDLSSREYLTLLQKRYAKPELPDPDQTMPMLPNALASASTGDFNRIKWFRRAVFRHLLT